MIVDIHTHLFPKDVRENRTRYFSGEPAFEMLYGPPKSRIAGASDIIEIMDEQGVDISVVFGFPWKNEEWFIRHNDYIMEAVNRYPDRLIGLGCFDAEHPDAVMETKRCLDGGLSGIGELAFYGNGIDENALDKLAPIMEICRENDCPIMVHTNEPVGHMYPGKSPISPNQVLEMVKRFPENKLILAHWGGGVFFFHLLKKGVREHFDNVYYDTAASPFLYEPEIYRRAIDIIGVERILFGTDFPLLQPKRYYKEFEAACLTPGEIDMISGTNAAVLLGLNPDSETV